MKPAQPGEHPAALAAGPAGPQRWHARFPRSTGLLLGVAAVLFLGFWLLDTVYFGRRIPATAHAGPWHLLVQLDPETLENGLGSLAQVVVAVLGIAITVVSIVVQLAATRYTSRIAEMFFHDRTNLAIMGFFVVACIDAVWVSVAVTGGFVPRASVGLTVVLVTASLLLLVPYFTYVFAFLDPEKVIARIGNQVLDAVLARGAARRARGDLEARQAGCVAGLEHLSDIAVNAVAQKDKIIATGAVTALREVAVRYLGQKPALPPAWFVLGERVQGNPDFIALTDSSLRSIERERVWVEWKVMHHLRSVFSEALDHLPELGQVVAIETRYIGERASERTDRDVLVLVIRYFNTYLRGALRQRDVRAAHGILHQYRILAERLMDRAHGDVVVEIGRSLAYYGQAAHEMDLGFVTETVAHDLARLCELAFARGSGCHDALLGIFLDLDRPGAKQAGQPTLRGVRKAQVRLATFYLARRAGAHAGRIAAGMRGEAPERMASIERELRSASDREFREITDRGASLDALDDERRGRLDEFFALLTPR